jgi:hypothetical protein
MDRVTQGNAESAGQNATTADALNNQAETMERAVNDLIHLVRGRDQTVEKTLSRPAQTSASRSRLASPKPALAEEQTLARRN